MAYSTAERKSVREAEKASRQADLAREEVVRSVMSTPSGRQYLWDRLSAAHVFSAILPTDSLAMSFAEGERNQGLQLLADIMSSAPDAFILAMREANVRSITADARTSTGEHSGSSNGDGGAEGPDPDLFVR